MVTEWRGIYVFLVSIVVKAVDEFVEETRKVFLRPCGFGCAPGMAQLL
jgi:hypothetical protein